MAGHKQTLPPAKKFEHPFLGTTELREGWESALDGPLPTLGQLQTKLASRAKPADKPTKTVI
jgi:hypothetical protein